jgi:L-ascorbate metabolism protein UlaG (beta-lactamase superfamily)
MTSSTTQVCTGKHLRGLLLKLAGAGLVLLLGFVAVVLVDGCASFGRRAEGERRVRMERSPQWSTDGDKFVNPQPLVNDGWAMLTGAFSASPHRSPAADDARSWPVPVSRGRFATTPASGMRATWLGHSTALVELDGHRVLTDPVWSDRASPLGWLGPRRWYPPPLPLAELPALDAVVVSHDHYDHLDRPSIVALREKTARFVVPLGVGAHLVNWGVPEAQITELDWWGETTVNGLRIVCTPARHASGRMLVDNDSKLWAGYALVGPRHRAYYSGDTGLFPAMRDIGARLGPFDLTLIEVGQYDRAWPDWHIGPEQAVLAHQLVGGKVMLPVHWGLFELAFHGLNEPIERALVAGSEAGVTVVAPRPGESFEPAAPPPVHRWWPQLAWQTSAQHPIVSGNTGLDVGATPAQGTP